MAITDFKGTGLSNFDSPWVSLDGEWYSTLEHAYQAAKTHNLHQRRHIREQPTPGKAKREGGKLELRPDWEQVKQSVMLALLRQKFQHEPYRSQLLATGNEELIEGNTWGDRVWGCVLVDGKWVGQNLLGKMLMLLREELLVTGQISLY